MKRKFLVLAALSLAFLACSNESGTNEPSTNEPSGRWIINNNTGFWVQIKKPDLSQTYAVIPPYSIRFSVSIALNTPYDYAVYFSKELKYNGTVVATLETTDQSQAGVVQVSDASPAFTTMILAPPAISVDPMALVKNNTSKAVRMYYAGEQKPLGNDTVIVSGGVVMAGGFESGGNTNRIEFRSPAWEQNKKVLVDMVMLADKVYEITIPANEEASDISVTEADVSAYYN
jgi:hypothetical protein